MAEKGKEKCGCVLQFCQSESGSEVENASVHGVVASLSTMKKRKECRHFDGRLTACVCFLFFKSHSCGWCTVSTCCLHSYVGRVASGSSALVSLDSVLLSCACMCGYVTVRTVIQCMAKNRTDVIMPATYIWN